jgi:hypothetical protein
MNSHVVLNIYSWLGRKTSDIKINEFIQKPVSIKDLVKSVQGHIIINANLK